jgi:hypothetical protein
VFVNFLLIEMADLKEQRVCVNFFFFFFHLGKTAAETVAMLKEAFKDEAMGKTQVYERFIHFKIGEMSVVDQPSCGHPSMSRTDKINEITGVS